MTRRLPPPWPVFELAECFRVDDANGISLAYVYFERDERRAEITGRLTYIEAKKVAYNIAKLPELLKKD